MNSKLRTWRITADFTLADMAALTGYSAPMFSLAERGKKHFSPTAKVHVARCLGVQVADLFDPPEPAEALTDAA